MKKTIILLIVGLMVLTSCRKRGELLNNNKEADNSSLTTAVDVDEEKLPQVLDYIPFICVGGIGLCLGAILMLAWQDWHQKPQWLLGMTEEFTLREIIAYFFNTYRLACSMDCQDPVRYATNATVNRYKRNIGG